MTTLLNSFEGGTSGTTVSTGNSGGASGNAFDAVSVGSGATVAFSNTHAAHGSLSCEIATTSSATAYVEWTTSMGSQTQAWFRQYLYFTANPGGSMRVLQISSGTTGMFLRVTTAGQFAVVNNTGNVVITTTAASMPLNQWFRIEGFANAGNGTTTGQTELKLFSTANSAVPEETDTSAANLGLGASFSSYFFGVAAATASVGAFWMDDLGLSSTGYIGPVKTTTPRSGSIIPALIAMGGPA